MPDRDSFAQQQAASDHVFSFFRKARLDWLLLHFPPRVVRSACVFVNGFITIGVLALRTIPVPDWVKHVIDEWSSSSRHHFGKNISMRLQGRKGYLWAISTSISDSTLK